MNYTAEDLQMDLFAPSRPMLCPALEKWQESYDKALDRKWKRQLCSSWKIAEKNSNGVYAEHWHAAINSRNGLMLELSMALRGDDVVAELDLESRIDNSYGRYSPLSDYCPMAVFGIYDDIDQVAAKLTTAVNAKIVDDQNLSDNSREKLLQMVPLLIERATKAIIN